MTAMQILPTQVVSEWAGISNFWLPHSIHVSCPLCGKKGTFTLGSSSRDIDRDTFSFTSRCPTCQERVHFWAVGVSKASEQQPCKCLCMFPLQSKTKNVSLDLSILPERIRSAFLEAITVYNDGAYSAAANSCRRTLEGILKEFFNETDVKDRLPDLIKELKNTSAIQKTLIDLSELLKTLGDYGSHFDRHFEHNYITAGQMIDLTEDFLDYVYLLPNLIDDLKQTIKTTRP